MTTQKKNRNQRMVKQSIKACLTAIIMLVFHIQIWASNNPVFSEGMQLFVMANSGLTLRMEPKQHSESLGVVEFGSMVIVLNQPDTAHHFERVNWVDGNWIYVEYEGVFGWMFDGFLTNLPVPKYEFEKCQLDMDLVYPLEAWSEIHMDIFSSDTIESGTYKRVNLQFEDGNRMVKTVRNEQYKIELYFNEIRIMDAYHLLQSMMDGKRSIEKFKKQATFIENEEGDLFKVKIDLENPVRILKMSEGTVQVTIWSENYLCGL